MLAPCSQGCSKTRRDPIAKTLSGLTIGSLTLTPEFSSDVTTYAVTTTNATNKVTATPTSADATVECKLGDTEFDSGDTLTWAEGENTVTVKVTGDDGSTTYTVTVTAE